MTELLTAAQMRAIEAAAIASGEVTGLELMERAGRGVVQAVFAEWPELKAGSFRAVVLCGPGNNGGDGFVVARLLKEWGWEVEVFLYGTPEGMPPDARVNYERWRGMGEVLPCQKIPPREGIDVLAAFLRQPAPTLMVDALFGIGLSRPVEKEIGPLDAVFRNLKERPLIRRVAVDLPSGMCSDSGRMLGWGYRCELTVTFHRPKLGHHLAEGPENCGRLRVVDIGLATAMGIPVETVEAPHGLGKTTGHKFGHGHALILSGGPGKGGAARLAARGAIRIGAGLVTLGCPPEAVAENAARLDAIMLRPIADAGVLEVVLKDQRINALCLGPGMGTGEREAAMVRVALGVGVKPRPTMRPVVLDADALTLVAQDATLFAALHAKCVLTPHAGEFARLFPDIAAKLEAPATTGPAYSKVDATREAAARAGCVVLFKGADTVIASPDGTCAISSAHYDRAAPWLATAGSGDVLAGFITGLLARGFSPQSAAETGAWLHVECARSFGPGLIAEDLPEELPKVFRALGL